MKQIVLLGLLILCSLSPLANSTTSFEATLPEVKRGLKQVGEAQLSFWFIDVYQSKFFTASGQYQQNHFPQLLTIDYQQTISAKKLWQETKKQWQQLGFKSQHIEQYQSALLNIWPDISKGDQLAIHVEPSKSTFYFNQQAIGTIEDKRFGKMFLAIWLDEKSAYPELTQKLLGN